MVPNEFILQKINNPIVNSPVEVETKQKTIDICGFDLDDLEN